MEVLPSFRHVIQEATLILLIALIAACGGGSGSSTDPESSSDENFSAAETESSLTTQAMESIYNNRHTPERFYSEIEPDPTAFQTIAHIKNIDVLTPGSYNNATPRFELCTNDFNDALNLSIASGTNLGTLVNNSDNSMFFQFTRSLVNSPQLSNLQPIYKYNVVDRSALDIRNLNNHLGTYTENPKTAEQIKQLIEYLWIFSPENSYGNAVLSSTVSELTNEFHVRMQKARLTSAINSGSSCDRIDIFETNYTINKITRSIDNSELFQQSILSQFDGFSYFRCDAV